MFEKRETSNNGVDSLYHATDAETKRLRAQNDLMCDFARGTIRSLVYDDSLILDVGCANGEGIMSRLWGVRFWRLLGIDSDGDAAVQADTRFGGEQCVFVECDIFSDDFDELMEDCLMESEREGFDLIHISSVLLHLGNPVEALKRLHKYLAPGGKILIQDEDDGVNLVYPSSKFYENAFAIWADSLEAGDRFFARKLPTYLKEAGFTNVKLEKCGVSNEGLIPEYQEALWDIYFNYHLWVTEDGEYFRHQEETDKLVAELKTQYDTEKARYDAGETFISLGFFLFTAEK